MTYIKNGETAYVTKGEHFSCEGQGIWVERLSDGSGLIKSIPVKARLPLPAPYKEAPPTWTLYDFPEPALPPLNWAQRTFLLPIAQYGHDLQTGKIRNNAFEDMLTGKLKSSNQTGGMMGTHKPMSYQAMFMILFIIFLVGYICVFGEKPLT